MGLELLGVIVTPVTPFSPTLEIDEDAVRELTVCHHPVIRGETAGGLKRHQVLTTNLNLGKGGREDTCFNRKGYQDHLASLDGTNV